MNNLDVAFGTPILNNGLPFSKCKSRDMIDIILKAKNVSREHMITSRETTEGKILDKCYDIIRYIQTSYLLN